MNTPPLILPTLSKLSLARRCQASVALPQIREPAGEAAAGGSALGEFLQRVTAVGRDVALTEVKEDADRAMFACIQTEQLPLHAPGGRHELAFAYDVDTTETRILGVDIGRAYADLEWCRVHGVDRTRCVVGAIDFDWPDVADADTWCAVDWKRGWGAWENVPPAPVNDQTKLGGMVAAKLAGKSVSKQWVVRFSESGFPDWADKHVMDELDMMAYALELRAWKQQLTETWQRVRGEARTPDVESGLHCGGCNAKKHCPHFTGFIKAAVTSKIPTDLSWHEYASKLVSAIEAKKQAKTVHDALDAELKAWAKAHGHIPHPAQKGRVWGPHDVNGTTKFEWHWPKG